MAGNMDKFATDRSILNVTTKKLSRVKMTYDLTIMCCTAMKRKKRQEVQCKPSIHNRICAVLTTGER